MPESAYGPSAVEADEDAERKGRGAVPTRPDPERGILQFMDERFLLIRPEVLVNIQKQLEGTVGASSKGFLYLAGEKSVKEGRDIIAKVARGSVGESFPDDAMLRTLELAALAGWGRFRVTSVDESAGRYLLRLDNSAIAATYGPSKRPVCHFLAGWLAGVAEATVGKTLLCEEFACHAQGRPHCEFELRPMP